MIQAIGIDPGPETSTIVKACYTDTSWEVVGCTTVPTVSCEHHWLKSDPVFIERIVAQGIRVTQPTFTTATNAGALAQYFYNKTRPVYLVKRSAVLRLVTVPGLKKSTDAACRQGLIQHFGKVNLSGTHAWAALALAYYGIKVQMEPWLSKGEDMIAYYPPFESFIPEKP